MNSDMDTLVIKLTSSKTLTLIQELEQLKLLKILKRNFSGGTRLSEKYGGKLPSEIAKKLNDHIKTERLEWDNNI